MKKKTELTLDQLKTMPMEIWRLEAAEIWEDADALMMHGIAAEAEDLMWHPDITPEKVVELRAKLERTISETEAVAV